MERIAEFAYEVFTMITASAAASESSAPLRYDARALAAAFAPSVAIGTPQPGLYADPTRDSDETTAHPLIHQPRTSR